MPVLLPEDSYHPQTAPVYALDWWGRSTVGSHDRPGVRKATSFLTDDFRNQIAVLGLRDERVLVEDDADAYSELVTLVEATHGYPATYVQWQSAWSNDGGWANELMQKGADLLASTATRTPEAGQYTTQTQTSGIRRTGTSDVQEAAVNTTLDEATATASLVPLRAQPPRPHLQRAFLSLNTYTRCRRFHHWLCYCHLVAVHHTAGSNLTEWYHVRTYPY
jgi:hypothetical protein